MEGDLNSKFVSELVILHTAEAEEWATYLRTILKNSRKFRKCSILLYAVSLADRLHGYNFEYLHSSRCVVLLLTATFLDMLADAELHGALDRLLLAPRRVVALLCGVADSDIPAGSFEHWPRWRKLHSEDEPALYLSTIQEAMADLTRQAEAEGDGGAPAAAELLVAPAAQAEDPSAGEGETHPELMDEGSAANKDPSLAERAPCLTIQPSRIRCGEQITIYIIFVDKLDSRSTAEVEFSCDDGASKRVPATSENEYTLSVATPDMPGGPVSLTLHTDQSSIGLGMVRYYTNMAEVSRCLEQATNPMEFICQAFNIADNVTESLDNMLTNSLRSRMPQNGLHLFGIRQIEENNMAANQRDHELPTLLHFAAKYGLKKLTTALLLCPGALQAYSVMNRNGDYPNTLAERSGFSDLRQFMDEFVETADMIKHHMRDSTSMEEDGEEYEMMSATPENIIMKYGQTEDIYESMLGIAPECADDMYEVMYTAEENHSREEAMLRKFFQAKPDAGRAQNEQKRPPTEKEEDEGRGNAEHCKEGEEEEGGEEEEEEEEEDPYNLCPENVYDTVEGNASYFQEILNRPPAPVPRPQITESVEFRTYIHNVFSAAPQSEPGQRESSTAQPGTYQTSPPPPPLPPPTPPPPPPPPPSLPPHDPYAGVKTPGQRQLIALQERVKEGVISVDEAVKEFKAWQFDHEQRSNSIRYQQGNLKKLRDSITRRHQERQKKGGNVDYEITAPLQSCTMECTMYESSTHLSRAPAAASRPIQRGNWKTGSTSSTSSTESNRLSIQSIVSSSSSAEPDFEDALDILTPPSRPPRHNHSPPPSIPPRIPERMPEPSLQDRYISCPTRALPRIPTQGGCPPPPAPRRPR